MSLREQFEAAVIKRMKESGFLEVEIRVECLSRSGDGYADGSIDAYLHFWQESRAALVIDLHDRNASIRTLEVGQAVSAEFDRCKSAVEAAGVKVKP